MTTWIMPRDMSRFSALEAALLAAIHAAGLPEPVAEHHFAWCCEHSKRSHKNPMPVPHPGGGTRITPGCVRCQEHCHEIRHFCMAAVSCWDHEYNRDRDWRFDFAYPDRMLAIECEGGTFTGGRHTTGTGFEKDAEKYSEAAVRGWRVLRFTQRQITSGEALALIGRALSVVITGG